MDQAIRNKLRSVVTQCRRLLEEAVSSELQGTFGIYAGGKRDEVQVDPDERMTHLSDEDRVYRKDILDHLEHIKSGGFKAKDALDQLIREIAFTHLNRLCAYKMMEARELIRESVSKGLKSQGFLFYLADHPEDEHRAASGKQDVAYRHFLNWLGGTLSEEIGVLFSPSDSANRLYPPQRVLDKVLDLLNTGDIKPDEPELARAWNVIWDADETIGWVYQYFTPEENRKKARKDSPAPRNSYELAFRNQFFTPRYVVEFLTDNTLGRIWYEMQKGSTRLRDQCTYIVRRSTEIFLAEGEESRECTATEGSESDADLSQEALLRQPVYIAHRSKKDPRELKILDPACGSGHFLLYCFDLLQTIYEEAYTDPDLGPALQADYSSLDELRRSAPGLILANNLHGIDIDMRCTQIAALALWLRCQRAFQEMGLKKDRPKISRSNLVCAEPMPGEEQMLREFVSQLEPRVLGQLVEVIFDRMKLAGEAGSLLKIEEEIREAVAEAKKQWQAESERAVDRKGRSLLFTEGEMARSRGSWQQSLTFDVANLTDEQFFDEAESRVVEALRSYAAHASNGQWFQRRLFTEDALRGFGFVDMCQRRFDIVLMNPPFGEFTSDFKPIAKVQYSTSANDILCAFTERWYSRLNHAGCLGTITSRTPFFISTGEQWRESFLLRQQSLAIFADLGERVMDEAMVESAAYVLSTRPHPHTAFVRMLGLDDRELVLQKVIATIHDGTADSRTFLHDVRTFCMIPKSPFAYWIPSHVVAQLAKHESFEPAAAQIRVGLTTLDNPRFVRALHEIHWNELGTNGDFSKASGKVWAPLVIGGKSQPWSSPLQVCVKWQDNGSELRAHIRKRGSESRWIRSPEFYFRPGFSWTRRAVRVVPYAIPAGCIPTASRYMAFPTAGNEFKAIGITASNVASAYLRFYGEWFCRPNFLVDNVKTLPWVTLDSQLAEKLETMARDQVALRRRAYRSLEPSHDFSAPSLLLQDKNESSLAFEWSSILGESLDNEVAAAYGFSRIEYLALTRDLQEAIAFNTSHTEESGSAEQGSEEESEGDDDLVLNESVRDQYAALVSYCVGAVFGRWDIRLAIRNDLVPDLGGPFDPLPVCPPGALVNPQGLVATSGTIVSESWLSARRTVTSLPPPGSVPNETISDSEYPIAVKWDGIVVHDIEHPADLGRLVRDVQEAIVNEQADDVEARACEALGVKDLRDYLNRPGNSGFWDDHLGRYTKGRRKAPIYWLLQSKKKNYALWLYYHGLDKDMLFKALITYVEPKIKREENRLAEMRAVRVGGGPTGKEAKNLDREIEKQEELLSELNDFEGKLRKAANLNLEPDLNDGVVLNIAPLHELVPWKEAKKYWDELLEGKYEWSSIAKQLRERGIVK